MVIMALGCLLCLCPERTLHNASVSLEMDGSREIAAFHVHSLGRRALALAD